MNNSTNVLENALERIKPTPAELKAERKFSDKIISRIKSKVPKDVGVTLVGSVSKGTSLKGDGDIDIFLLFPKAKYHREDLATIGMKFAKFALAKGDKFEIGYAEHPYLKAQIIDEEIKAPREVEIVPSFKISSASELGSAADRSPLHTEYILKHLSEKQRDDVRLLKRFLKRLAVYGAEVKVEGFSGYLCELVIAKYGTFDSMIKAVSSWHEPVIDLESAYNSELEARQRFAFAPFTVIDPVDSKRNVAAAVSETSLSKFILASRAFLKSPSQEFFFETQKKITAKRVAEMKAALFGKGAPKTIAIKFPAPVIVPDILWPQLRRTARILFERLESAGFSVFDYSYWTDEEKECAIIFSLIVSELPNLEKTIGPEVHHEAGVTDFAAKHRSVFAGPWVGGNRIYAAKKRRFTKAEDLVSYILEHPAEYAIPSKLAELGKKHKHINEKILAKQYLAFLQDYVYKKHYYVEILGAEDQ